MKKTQNLENLHVFCEIVRTGSVKAASDALNTETSNAFRTVRQLEDELGVAIYIRPEAVAENGITPASDYGEAVLGLEV